MDQLMPVLNAAGTAYVAHPADAASAPQQINKSGNVANAQAQASITPSSATKTTYCSGIEVYAGGATVGLLVDVTVAGLLGGSRTFPFMAPLGIAIAAQPFVIDFNPPIPASAVNTAISVTLPALGAGNAKAQVVIKGGEF